MLEVVVLGSGSVGNATLVRGAGGSVLIDAGLSARQIETRLAAAGTKLEDLSGVLLTHEHGDHVRGLRVLLKKCPLPVYCNSHTAAALRASGTVETADWRIFESGGAFSMAGMDIEAFSVPHDAADPVGFVIHESDARAAFLTDLGFATQAVMERIRNVHFLSIETNHDEKLLQEDTRRPWSVKQRILSRHGHLSNVAAAQVVAAIAHDALEQVVLGHLSRDCNTPDLALSTLRDRGGMPPNTALFCAMQEESSPVFRVKSR